MPTVRPAEVRTVAVGPQRLRVAIRPGTNEAGHPPRPPFLLIGLRVYPGGHLGLITEAAALAPVVDGFLAAP
jgi:hypothetical protein